MTRNLVIRDEVHGDMTFSPLLREVINHRFFQRLRGIKQLGLAEYVFPGATHTRFQHCLGASYLASRYFDSIVRHHSLTALYKEQVSNAQDFALFDLREDFRSVASCEKSIEFWREIASLSGLLHDLGHGPWSHTFENLGIKQDFSTQLSALPHPFDKIVKQQQETNGQLMHEEITLIYLHQLFEELGQAGTIDCPEAYFFAVGGLVHQKLMSSGWKDDFLKALNRALEKSGVRGGQYLFGLLLPIISGPFDVDRMDYIQRDGKNCGVDIGAIEWRRIISKVIPYLGDSEINRPTMLISSLKNQHVLDDFVFSLFQMYTQVYLHPMIVGFEEVIKTLLKRHEISKAPLCIDFKTHQGLSDEGLRQWFKKELGTESIEHLLGRQKGFSFEVSIDPKDETISKKLEERGFNKLKVSQRAMLQETNPVYLYHRLMDERSGTEELLLTHWTRISPVASLFPLIHYEPDFWIKFPEKISLKEE